MLEEEGGTDELSVRAWIKCVNVSVCACVCLCVVPCVCVCVCVQKGSPITGFRSYKQWPGVKCLSFRARAASGQCTTSLSISSGARQPRPRLVGRE